MRLALFALALLLAVVPIPAARAADRPDPTLTLSVGPLEGAPYPGEDVAFEAVLNVTLPPGPSADLILTFQADAPRGWVVRAPGVLTARFDAANDTRSRDIGLGIVPVHVAPEALAGEPARIHLDATALDATGWPLNSTSASVEATPLFRANLGDVPHSVTVTLDADGIGHEEVPIYAHTNARVQVSGAVLDAPAGCGVFSGGGLIEPAESGMGQRGFAFTVSASCEKPAKSWSLPDAHMRVTLAPMRTPGVNVTRDITVMIHETRPAEIGAKLHTLPGPSIPLVALAAVGLAKLFARRVR